MAALDGQPPNTGDGFEQNEDGTIQTDGTFTMPQPIDLEQERADADVEASAFQVSLDHLVSHYEEIMKISHDPEPDRNANPKQELVRLRQLGDDLEHEIDQLTKLIEDMHGAQHAYHQMVYALPKKGRIRVQFTAEFSKFVQEHNVTESIKGAKKRIDELKGMLKQAAANHRQLGLSLPDKHVNFDMDSDNGSIWSYPFAKHFEGSIWSYLVTFCEGFIWNHRSAAAYRRDPLETVRDQAVASTLI
ncbi:hypothetical protein AAVH_13749 [Aphelenchoides avenae]|nr:hypothetical protein AAVH_13749 [Aphelenchus avenae]